MNKVRSTYLFNLLWIIVIISVFYGYIEIKFKLKRNQHNTFIKQVWSHRGIHKNTPENSYKSLLLAKNQGFKGVEIDVFYDDDLGFVVSHDYPYKLVDDKIVLLNQLIDSFATDFKYWIDLKNLDKSNSKNIVNAFQGLFDKHIELSSSLYVESANLIELRKLAKNDIQSIAWVQYSKKQPKQWLKLLYLKAILGHSDFAGITSHFRYIDDKFKSVFAKYNWFIFTVNDNGLIYQLMENNQTAVVLTDLEKHELAQ